MSNVINIVHTWTNIQTLHFSDALSLAILYQMKLVHVNFSDSVNWYKE